MIANFQNGSLPHSNNGCLKRVKSFLFGEGSCLKNKNSCYCSYCCNLRNSSKGCSQTGSYKRNLKIKKLWKSTGLIQKMASMSCWKMKNCNSHLSKIRKILTLRMRNLICSFGLHNCLSCWMTWTVLKLKKRKCWTILSYSCYSGCLSNSFCCSYFHFLSLMSSSHCEMMKTLSYWSSSLTYHSHTKKSRRNMSSIP